MEFKRFNDTVVVRMNRGEEVLEQLKAVAAAEKIKLGSITAIGAADDITVGVYDTIQKKYDSNTFKGEFEILSLLGTITTHDGEFYPHLHLTAGDHKGNAFGGHLNRAIISATCEMIITVIDGVVEREKDEEVGLNLMKFL